MHGISDLPLRKDSIQGDGIVLGTGPMGPIFLMWIGQFLGVLECTVRDWDAAIFSVQLLFEPYMYIAYEICLWVRTRFKVMV